MKVAVYDIVVFSPVIFVINLFR